MYVGGILELRKIDFRGRRGQFDFKKAKNAKFGHFGPQKWTFWQNFEKVIPKSFLDHFSL